MSPRTLGLDVGGTKIASGLVGLDGTVVEARTTATTGRGLEVVDQIAAVVSGYAVDRVGLVVPGAVEPGTGVVRRAANLGWHDLDVAGLLRERLGAAVHVENDASAAAWAEHRFGGAGAGPVVLVTVGTGLGGGIVVNGGIVRGHTGAGGEIGHLPYEIDGRPCECGSSGCWEQYASGRALQRAAGSSVDVLADPRAREIVAGVARHLVRGIAMITAALDPGCVLLGGGLGTDPRFLPFVQAAAAGAGVTPPRSPVPIRAAALGPLAGVIGAADLAASTRGAPGR